MRCVVHQCNVCCSLHLLFSLAPVQHDPGYITAAEPCLPVKSHLQVPAVSTLVCLSGGHNATLNVRCETFSGSTCPPKRNSTPVNGVLSVFPTPAHTCPKCISICIDLYFFFWGSSFAAYVLLIKWFNVQFLRLSP